MRNLCIPVLVFLSTICFLIAPIYAEETAPTEETGKGWRAGIKVGLNVSDVWDSDYNIPGETVRVGFIGGGFLTVTVNKWFSVQPEILYTQKGFGLDGARIFGFPNNFDATVKLDYIEIPVLAVVTIPTGSFATPMVYTGPSFDFKVSARATGSVGSLSESTSISKYIHTFDFCWIFGGGVILDFGTLAVTAEGRYTISALDVTDNSSMKNDLFSLLFGIGF